jgi:hypothetical protein
MSTPTTALYSWKASGLPRKGWSCIDVEDHEEPAFECELCGNPEVRFVHVMVHGSVEQPLRVGCVCAEHLEQDYAAPRQRERIARNTAARRARLKARHELAREHWTNPRTWRTSSKGNLWRKAVGLHVVVFPNPWRGAEWKLAIGDQLGTWSYRSAEDAMARAFDRLFPIRRLLAEAPALLVDEVLVLLQLEPGRPPLPRIIDNLACDVGRPAALSAVYVAANMR